MLARLTGFFAINNMLLLLRAPVISLLVEQAHFNYLAANMLTLVSATVLRYAVADKLLWPARARRKAPLPVIEATGTTGDRSLIQDS